MSRTTCQMQHILIPNGDEFLAYPCNTAEEILAAQIALFEHRIEKADLRVGESDGPDSYRNGQTLSVQPRFSHAALERIEETAADWHEDVELIRTQKIARQDLVALCLKGADDDRVMGWHDYVDAVFALAEELGFLKA